MDRKVYSACLVLKGFIIYKVLIYSIVTAKEAVRRSIGYCPQFDAFDGLLTAREVLAFYAKVKGIPPCDINEVSGPFN